MHSIYELECTIRFPDREVLTRDLIPVRYTTPPLMDLIARASGMLRMIAGYSDLSFTQRSRIVGGDGSPCSSERGAYARAHRVAVVWRHRRSLQRIVAATARCDASSRIRCAASGAPKTSADCGNAERSR